MGQGGRWTLDAGRWVVVLVTRGDGEALLLLSQRGTVGLPVIVCRMARPKRHTVLLLTWVVFERETVKSEYREQDRRHSTLGWAACWLGRVPPWGPERPIQPVLSFAVHPRTLPGQFKEFKNTKHVHGPQPSLLVLFFSALRRGRYSAFVPLLYPYVSLTCGSMHEPRCYSPLSVAGIMFCKKETSPPLTVVGEGERGGRERGERKKKEKQPKGYSIQLLRRWAAKIWASWPVEPATLGVSTVHTNTAINTFDAAKFISEFAGPLAEP